MQELEEYTKNLKVEHLIESSLMIKVMSTVKNIISSPEKRFMALLGPKGFGKTCTLKYLSKNLDDVKTIYANLNHIGNFNILDEIQDKKNIVLLLDNAQVFERQFSARDFKLVVAAFSPNAEATSSTKTLIDHMGFTMIPMYYTPFRRQDIHNFLRSLGYKVVATEQPINFKAPIIEKRIQQITLDQIVFKTNGNPRYIHDYLLTQTFDSMLRELDKQFKQIHKLLKDGSTDYFESKHSLCNTIIKSFCGVTNQSLLDLGLVYRSNDTKIYLANNYYCKLVIELGYLKVYKSTDEYDLGNLETLCDFVLSSKCHSLAIPEVTFRMVQDTYNDRLPVDGVVLVRLLNNHPAIDFLIIDNTNRFLFMIQTSFQKYSDRTVKYDAIHRLQIEGISVLDFYCDKTGIAKTRVKYVYATYRPTKVRDSHVDVLPLNNYPELLQEA